MKQSTLDLLEEVLAFLREVEPESKWHPTLFMSGPWLATRGAMPTVIRKLKKAEVIVISGRNIDGQPLYSTGPGFRPEMTALDF